jgi:hypothetical protein
MLPEAAIVHSLPGRTRVRVEERRHDAVYFAHVAEQLRQCPSVVDVTVTPVTGSVLILHEGTDRDTIAGYAKAFELFDLVLPAARAPEAELLPDQIVLERLHRVDRWMRQQSDGGADLRSMALIALLAGAVWQLARGQVLPAGATLLWYALALTRERKSATSALDEVVAASEASEAGPEGVHEN